MLTVSRGICLYIDQWLIMAAAIHQRKWRQLFMFFGLLILQVSYVAKQLAWAMEVTQNSKLCNQAKSMTWFKSFVAICFIVFPTVKEPLLWNLKLVKAPLWKRWLGEAFLDLQLSAILWLHSTSWMSNYIRSVNGKAFQFFSQTLHKCKPSVAECKNHNSALIYFSSCVPLNIKLNLNFSSWNFTQIKTSDNVQTAQSITTWLAPLSLSQSYNTFLWKNKHKSHFVVVRYLPLPCCVLEQDTLLPESTG